MTYYLLFFIGGCFFPCSNGVADGIDDVALVAYGMKDVAALDTMWDVPYSPNGCDRR